MTPRVSGSRLIIGAGLSIGLAGLLAGSLSPLAPEHALAECNPNRTNDGGTYVDGWTAYKPTALYDVAANIKVVDTWVYSGSYVLSWSMLWKGTATDPSTWRWAQTEWREYSGNVRDYTTQWTDDNQGAHTWHDPNHTPSVGGTPHLKTEYQPAYGKFHFYLDSIEFPASDRVNWVADKGKIASEVHTLASQMPGTNSDGGEQYRNSILKVAGNWIAFDGYADNGAYANGRYFALINLIDTQSANVWDTCS